MTTTTHDAFLTRSTALATMVAAFGTAMHASTFRDGAAAPLTDGHAATIAELAERVQTLADDAHAAGIAAEVSTEQLDAIRFAASLCTHAVLQRRHGYTCSVSTAAAASATLSVVEWHAWR